ncbi:spermatogenesis-associated protein 46 isoform X3 [Felis catus]|uniref:Spermatogenesis associated 46 n=1 Tax=Felis catus TaxID=9685 RepID=A0ABI7X9V8_FELCA|nr:spermatogenesis-associated protein 46 isoform X3 [Felis catus]
MLHSRHRKDRVTHGGVQPSSGPVTPVLRQRSPAWGAEHDSLSSYFVCTDQESHLEAYSFPEVPRDKGRGDGCLPEDPAESICSSSSSQEDACPREAAKKFGHGLASTDGITSQDILKAARWHPAQQSGYKCAACCRMYPTLHSLKSHIKGGFREGFSCKVYYRKLKTLWGKEKARPGDRLSSGSCQAFK